MSPLVSVIVPVYNVEPYVRQCLLSIQAQSLSDFEVVIVNDGSEDGSIAICQQFADSDQRFRIVHQPNMGLSAARNTGIDNASGDFLVFVDSDDWVDPDYLSTLLDTLNSTGADFAAVSFWRDAALGPTKSRFNDGRLFVWSGLQAARMLCNDRLLRNFAWAKIVPRRLFVDNDVRFPVGKLFEDMYVASQLVHLSSRVALRNSALYHYRVRTDSIAHNLSWKSSLHYMQARFAQFSDMSSWNVLPPSSPLFLSHVLHFARTINRLPSSPESVSVISEVLSMLSVYDDVPVRQLGLFNSFRLWLLQRHLPVYLAFSRCVDRFNNFFK